MAKGGGMKGTKYKSMGGGMKSTKGFSRGGAALQSEMKANPGMGNMPKSVMAALAGSGAPTPGLAKPMAKAMRQKAKGTKSKAKGGKV